jgi:hypothetical protein
MKVQIDNSQQKDHVRGEFSWDKCFVIWNLIVHLNGWIRNATW